MMKRSSILRTLYIAILCLFSAAHACFAELTIQEKIETRNFPSIFGAWGGILVNRPELTYAEMNAYHDLFWSPSFGLRFEIIDGKVELLGDFQEAKRQRDELVEFNPNMICLLQINIRGAAPNSWHLKGLYKDDFPWLRSSDGSQVLGSPPEQYVDLLIDFTHPKAQEVIVGQAVAVYERGLWDGIFFDFWTEKGVVLGGYRTPEEERQARIEILKRIRAAVSDDFLILVNGSPTENTAPSINGIFMETFRANRKIKNYNHEGLEELGNKLLWAEESLREPRINCLEAEGIGSELPTSPNNLRDMRLLTTLSLTHSDGYVSYTMGVQWDEKHPHDDAFLNYQGAAFHRNPQYWIRHREQHDTLYHLHHHEHYWNDFWGADLGQPIGKKAQLYKTPKGISIEGLFIREFTNGWAVHNRSGKERKIYLPEKASAVESGAVNKHWHTLPDLDGEIFLKQTTPTAEPSIETQNRYDVDDDGDVDISDARLVVLALGQKGKNINNPRTDVNKNNKVDKNDVLLVIDNLDDANGAPLNTDLLSPLSEETMQLLNPTILRSTLKALRLENDGSLKYQQAITYLEHLLAAIRPDATQLLANYPNPFNPETWIPYHLATDTDVEIRIYDTRGSLVRSLELGHQRAGIYTGRSRAAYWDGRNDVGERVASGVYLYQLQADGLSYLRKMVIVK